MRLLSVFFIIISIASYYFSVHARMEEYGLKLVELEGQLPAPLWQITLGLGVLFFILSPKKTPPAPRTISPTTPKRPKRTVAPAPPKTVPTSPASSTEEMDESWREELAEKATSYTFPRGGKIKLDTQKDVPFTLIIGRLTHQAKKDSIERFAVFISEIPTPKRIIIRFEEACDKGVQNMIRAAFRKHNHISDIIVRSESYQTEIQFHHPDQKWQTHYNILRSFNH